MGSIKITFAGDFASINDAELNTIKIETRLKQEINKSDYFFLNLEAPITDSKVKRIKAGSNLKIKPSHRSLLTELNVKGVSLANNHIFDYEEQGAIDTMELLTESDIAFWGIGKNKNIAWEPYIFEKNNIRIAVVSYADHEFNWLSDEDWCTSMIEPASNIIQISEVSKTVDHLIVFTHTGPENWHYPSPRQVKLFRNFIDAGASAVLNSHSHTIMGMEFYKNKPIYYSLGNFFFPDSTNKQSWYKGIAVELTLNNQEQTVDSKEIPIKFSNTNIDIETNKTLFRELFNSFSDKLNDNKFIQNKWDEFGIQEQGKLFREIVKGLVAILIGSTLSPFSNRFKIIRMKGIAILRGYAICENHIENIGNILNFKLSMFSKNRH